MHTIFVLLKTTTAWLKLDRQERNKIAESVLADIFKNDRVTVRLFDAEAFATRCTDVAMFQTKQIEQYYYVMERLRDSVLITHPYFETVDIIPTIENGFRQFEQNEKEDK